MWPCALLAGTRHYRSVPARLVRPWHGRCGDHRSNSAHWYRVCDRIPSISVPRRFTHRDLSHFGTSIDAFLCLGDAVFLVVTSGKRHHQIGSILQVRDSAGYFFLPLASNCLRKAVRSLIFFSSFSPANAILVPGTLAFGSLMYSLNVGSSQVRPEFLLAAE